MNDPDLFELCKQASAIFTEWRDLDYFHCSGIIVHRSQMDDDDFFGEVVPLFTSDYLLEKLPKPVCVIKRSKHYNARMYGDTDTELSKYADTPLKALLKLALALDDAGVKL